MSRRQQRRDLGHGGLSLTLGAVLWAGCLQDGQLSPKPGDDPFDTGSPLDSAPHSAGETDPPPGRCPDQAFPAGPLEVDDACERPAHVSTPLRLAPLWTNEDVGPSYATPAVGRLDDDDGDGDVDLDDHPDVIFGRTDGTIFALDGRDGTQLWEGEGNPGYYPSAAAVGDLDGDGRPEVVVSGTSGTLALDGGSGALRWASAVIAGGAPAAGGAVGLADLEGDGRVEVLLGRTVLSGDDGALLFEGDAGAGTGNGDRGPVGFAADLDLDGVQEVLVGNAAYRLDGSPLWRSDEPDGYVAPLDADGDDEGELVVCTLGEVRLVDDDGSVLWRTEVDEDNCGPPTVADLDGDGVNEIAVASTWRTTALDLDGRLRWEATTNDTSSGWTGTSAFDFDGDGAHELVYTDQVSFYILDGVSGAARALLPEHASGTLGEYPVVADLDGDGDADLLYVSAAGFGAEVGVRAFTSGDEPWPWARGLWSQHAETSLVREESGEVPAHPSPSWLVDDRFHAAGAPPPPYVARPALVARVLDLCELRCDEGEVELWVALGNAGTVEAPPGVQVDVIGESEQGEVLLERITWPEALPPGQLSEGRRFVLRPPGPLLGLRLDVDPGDALDECGDAEPARWSAAICAEGG